MNANHQRWLEQYLLNAAEIGIATKRRVPPINLILCMGDDLVKDFDLIYTDGRLDALTRPLNICYASPLEEGWKDLQIHHVRQGDLKDIRGLPVVARKVLNWRVCGLTDDGEFKDTESILRYVTMDEKDWKVVTSHGRVVNSTPGEQDWKAKVGVAIGMQCFDEYCWHANIEFEKGSPAVSLVADDALLEDVLKMRDVPVGKGRRDRVIHMVNNHLRSTNKGQVTVNKHLRGCIEHLWQGCRMQVFPPVNDLYTMKPTPKVEKVKQIMASTS